MIDTRYWRTAAYLGFATGIGIGLFFIMSAFGSAGEEETIATRVAYRNSVIIVFFLLEMLPFTIQLFFYLSMNHILIPAEYVILNQAATILAAVSYTMEMAASVTLQYLLFTGQSLDTPLVDMFYNRYGITAAFVVLIWSYFLWKNPTWPRWLAVSAFTTSTCVLILELFNAQIIEIGMDVLAAIIIPVWGVLMSSYLLLRESSIQATQENTPVHTP